LFLDFKQHGSQWDAVLNTASHWDPSCWKYYYSFFHKTHVCQNLRILYGPVMVTLKWQMSQCKLIVAILVNSHKIGFGREMIALDKWYQDINANQSYIWAIWYILKLQVNCIGQIFSHCRMCIHILLIESVGIQWTQVIQCISGLQITCVFDLGLLTSLFLKKNLSSDHSLKSSFQDDSNEW